MPESPGTLTRVRRACVVVLGSTLLVGLVTVAPGGATALSSDALPAQAASAAAPSAPTQEGEFVSRINSLRASKGLSQLSVSGELASVARAWTSQMVDAGQISHNPNLAGQVDANWTKLGENVGVGYDVDGLMQAFINSPSHYKNLVDPDWNYVGVGVQFASDGRLFTTHNFMQVSDGGSEPEPEPEPEPPPPPPPTTAAPTTTVPPTTTTLPPPPPASKPERIAAVLAPLRSIDT